MLFISGCKSIKKNKNFTNLQENVKTEQVEEAVEASKIVDEDKSESEFVEEVVEQTVTKQEMIMNPVTNEVVSSPVVITTVKRKSSGKEKLNVKRIESVEKNTSLSFNQDLEKENNDYKLDKQSEGQDAGEIVGTISKFALEGIFKNLRSNEIKQVKEGLFGNTLKMLTSIVIVILLVIVFIKRKKDNKGSS
jgi:hypothetical protein